jgi:hypothetical protein
MIILIGASLLISLSIGALLTSLLLPSTHRNAAGLLFMLFAGSGLGLGITSCLYFACLLTGLTRYTAIIDLIVCLFLCVICFVRYRNKRGKQENLASTLPYSSPRSARSGTGASRARKDITDANTFRTGSSLEILSAIIFSIALVSSLISFVIAFLKEPHGRWDAWLIWNMHARFLFRGGEGWREGFASGLDWSHWDYPLLLPLSIARGWTYTGGEGIHLPAVIGFLFTFLILGLLLTALIVLRRRIQGYLAAMLLMGTPFFIYMGTSQFADIPLAFFILTTLAMLFFQTESPEDHPGALILAGLTAGLCAWTKNEGLLFLVIVTGCLFCMTAYSKGWGSSLRKTAWFLVGALPILMIVAYFKIALAPTNDIMSGFSVSAISVKLIDLSRYSQIIRAFFITGISFTQGLIDIRVGMHLNPGPVNILLLAVYLFITGIHIDQRDKMGLLQAASVLLLTTLGYFFVYVLTTLDLTYHLMTSLNRLLLQLWPGVIFVFFMIAGPPEQASAQRGAPEKTHASSELKSKQKKRSGEAREVK